MDTRNNNNNKNNENDKNNKKNNENTEKCPLCGGELDSDSLFCKLCQQDIDDKFQR